ncbi:IS21 family transposase [Glutamicibacter ardleyensis]|uniref:IS21 family transposase n=1 Tax=Glutamicibacter ardleyensis TaxID=225894 RepID=UPI003FD60D5B
MVRKIKAKRILQLRAEGFSGRTIASSQGISRNSVAEVFNAADAASRSWDELKDLNEEEAYQLLFPGRSEHESVFVQPDWSKTHKELAKVGTNLKLLHAEYADQAKASGAAFMGYDRFCKSYQRHVLEHGATSRVEHKAGISVEVDWSGPTMSLHDPVTGQRSTVYLFVACLPFSRYAFVEPCLDMKQDSWMLCHAAMFTAFGGSAPRIVCDNLKTGVIKHPAEGEIVLNDAYRHLAEHYSAAVLPGRVRKPKDKSSVENTVGHVATWVIASLRQTRFTSLDALRAAVYRQMAAYNAQPFQKRAGSRQSVFREEEHPLLRPLPVVPYEISTWVQERKVAKNSYVTWKKNFYSVLLKHVGATVDLRITSKTLEVYLQSQRLSSHLLFDAATVNQYRTNDADIPPERKYRSWDENRLRGWAHRIGPNTVEVIDKIFVSVPVAEQGINPALAVLRLSSKYGAPRLENACFVALASRIRSPRYGHLHPILQNRQDEHWKEATLPPAENSTGYVRGSDYYSRTTR